MDTYPFLNEINKVTVVDNGDGTFSLKTTGSGAGGSSNVIITNPIGNPANTSDEGTHTRLDTIGVNILQLISNTADLLLSKNTPRLTMVDVPGATPTDCRGFIIGGFNSTTRARLVATDFTAGLYDIEQWFMPTTAGAVPINHYDIYRRVMTGDYDGARNITVGVALSFYTVVVLRAS